MITPREAAQRLQVTPRTIYLWIRAGKLDAVRISERVTRIPTSEVERLLQAAVSPDRPDLSSVLWDVDIACIDEEAHSRFIIRRILEAGRPEHLAWLFRRYSLDEILDVAERDRALPHRVAASGQAILRRRSERAA
jgi:excisionase family DNA binding protein